MLYPGHRQFARVCCMILTPALCSLFFPSAFSQSVIITADPALPASLANPLTLTCTVTLSGLTEISWTDSRVTNTSNELSTDLSTGVSTLTIPDVVSADLGEYVCTATDGTASINYVITVTAIRK